MIDDLFNDEELIILEYLKNANIKKLQKVGVVTQDMTEENGVVTETITFTSFDNKYNFVKSNTYFVVDQLHEQVKKLNQAIENAVEDEDYLLAAELRDQKEELLQKQV